MSSTRHPAIEVTIDEVVLHGFEPRHRAAVGRALQRELSRLLAQSGPAAFRQNLTIDHLDIGPVSVPSTAHPTAVGTEVARAVHGRFGS